VKIAILGDCHFGVRSDNLAFHSYFARFYRETFFPYLEKHNIKVVVQTGDLFDRRKFINYNTLQLSKGYFFNWFTYPNRPILLTYPGNHDIFYRNSLQINSQDSLLSDYVRRGFIKSFSEPTTYEFEDGTQADFIPWICRENETNIKKFIETTTSQIAFGHFEIAGFEMERGNICNEGMQRSSLDRYEIAISGHFHHKSSDGHVYYVGAPCEHTWSDYDDPRGFHIFDTQTRDLEFIENPFQIHHKVVYDDSIDTLEGIQSRDFGRYTTNIVKVVVQSKTNPFMFDIFMEKLYQSNPLDVSIVENFTDTNISDEDVAEHMDNTITLITKAVDGIETNLDKDRLKIVMRDIYREAEVLESAKGNVQ
jgi:DNA repair exonuclease SbcCD nuclease subunit